MEPNAPGAAPASSPSPASAAPSAPPALESQITPEAGAASGERSGNWLSTAIRAVTGRGAGEPDADAAPDEQAEGRRSDATEPDWKPPTWGSKADYDSWLYAENRRYADRQDTVRAQRSQAAEAAERDARIADLERQKGEARAQGDTWRIGELQEAIDAETAGVAREQQQTAALSEFVGQVRAESDATVLDPLVRALPAAVAKRLIEDASARDDRGALVMAPDGLPVGITTMAARAQLVEAAIKALRDAAREEGRAQARKDPVVRKELLAEFAQSPAAAEREPVEVGGAVTGSGPRDMNAWLRSASRTRRNRNGDISSE